MDTASMQPIDRPTITATVQRLVEDTYTEDDAALVIDCAKDEILLWIVGPMEFLHVRVVPGLQSTLQLYDCCPPLNPYNHQTADSVSTGITRARRHLIDAGIIPPEPEEIRTLKRKRSCASGAAEGDANKGDQPTPTSTPTSVRGADNDETLYSSRVHGEMPYITKWTYPSREQSECVMWRVEHGLSWDTICCNLNANLAKPHTKKTIQCRLQEAVKRFDLWLETLGPAFERSVRKGWPVDEQDPHVSVFVAWSKLKSVSSGRLGHEEANLIRELSKAVLKPQKSDGRMSPRRAVIRIGDWRPVEWTPAEDQLLIRLRHDRAARWEDITARFNADPMVTKQRLIVACQDRMQKLCPKPIADYDLGDSMSRKSGVMLRIVGMALSAAPAGHLTAAQMGLWISQNIPGYVLGLGAWESAMWRTLGWETRDAVRDKVPSLSRHHDGRRHVFEIRREWIDKVERWEDVRAAVMRARALSKNAARERQFKSKAERVRDEDQILRRLIKGDMSNSSWREVAARLEVETGTKISGRAWKKRWEGMNKR